MPTAKHYILYSDFTTESLLFYKNNPIRIAAITSGSTKTPEVAALSAVLNAIKLQSIYVWETKVTGKGILLKIAGETS